jgi:hypothetical protein
MKLTFLEPGPIERGLRFFNLTERLRTTEAGIRLSADTDGNEQQLSAKPGQIMMSLLFFYCEKVREEIYIFSVCFSHDNFNDTCKFSVVKQASTLVCFVQLLLFTFGSNK